MEKKYEFTGETKTLRCGTVVRRIKRLSDGLIGGWIEKEANLSHNGNSFVYGNSWVYGNAWVKYGHLTIDIKSDLVAYIKSSLNIVPYKGKYLVYKRVLKTKKKGEYLAEYDNKTKYTVGKITKVKKYNTDFIESCSSGFHFSTPTYCNKEELSNSAIILCEVDLKDIITCMSGKIRAIKCKVIGEV